MWSSRVHLIRIGLFWFTACCLLLYCALDLVHICIRWLNKSNKIGFIRRITWKVHIDSTKWLSRVACWHFQLYSFESSAFLLCSPPNNMCDYTDFRCRRLNYGACLRCIFRAGGELHDATEAWGEQRWRTRGVHLYIRYICNGWHNISVDILAKLQLSFVRRYRATASSHSEYVLIISSCHG